MPKYCHVLFAGCVLLAPHVIAGPAPVASWDFDDAANPLKATAGVDLVLQGEHQPAAGIVPGDGACTIGEGSYFRAGHGIAVQAGQRRINAYTFVIDFMTPVDTHSHALFQSNLANDDDSDFKTLNREGVIGAGFVGFSPQWSFAPGEWHRLIVCADLAEGRYDVYLNGALAIHGAPQDLDRRYSLDPDGVLFFADDGSDDKEVTVSRIAIYGYALSEEEVAHVAGMPPSISGNSTAESDGLARESLGEVPDSKTRFLTAPYMMSVSQTGITLMWETNEPLPGSVAVAGIEKPALASHAPSGFGSFIYTAALAGLTPGTKYLAEVTLQPEGRNETLLAESVEFTTAPADTVPFSFSVWSDSQGHNRGAYEADIYEPTNSMLAHMAASDIAFGVACGDMAEDGGSYDDTRNYFLNRVALHLGTKKPFFIAWGNHDDYRGAILRQFASFPSKDMPNYDAGYGSYSFDYAGCHFVCIDYATQWPDIFHWVEEDLRANQNAKFTFFFIHEQPFCELWIDGESTMRSQLVPLLERYGVDAVFSGHTHEYERGYLNGVYYCITGGGSWLDHGEPVVKDWPHMTVGGAQDIPGFKNGLVNEYVRVTVGDDSWKAEAIGFNPDGTEIGVIDTFSSNDPPAADARADKQVVHTVLFWLSHELTDEDVAAFERGLDTLRSIDGVESMHYGRPLAADRPIADDSYTVGLTLVFRDEAALESYLPDPVHQAFVTEFSPYWTKAQVYDFRQE